MRIPIRSRKVAAYTYGIIALISCAGVLLIDALVGSHFLPADKRARIRHHVYHHTLAPHVAVNDNWGGFFNYKLCTDGNGFKSDCHATTRKHFDIGIIGDSFTEGLGLPYEQTFVGLIANAHPELAVANLGVVSYSPSIYFAKVRYLLSQGYTFKKLHVYIDIGDIRDEAVDYDLQDSRVVRRGGRVLSSALIEFWGDTREIFPLTAHALDRMREDIFYIANNEPSILSKDYPRSAWSYDPNVQGYEPLGVEGGIKNALNAMDNLYVLLKEKNIQLSVGVYPWPGQLLYDTQESRQVVLWREFCRTRCEYFFNSFPAFFALAVEHGADSTIHDYYLEGDVHFNAAGNKVLADTYMSTIAQ